ncbi:MULTISPECIES: hypothetical protein [unclassified Arthrobacter]|uniref:hypothetical protein n=1 Tax=unclassified Arthrobacter TaxID=235627 RepID=UPI002107ABFC|nr:MULTISPECIES: hypothetical protein [unclassified Arthrobacter]MCQ1947194.1 hypothetical protein [Arthrobacter sp. zg-Y1116]MCQ1995319.1 hypothetical protein [Arthrobacter sp. zg-Y1171]UWX80642.1 hypothetical protein N2L00_09335 [Arthrobacter sp. zg-Y1171]
MLDSTHQVIAGVVLLTVLGQDPARPNGAIMLLWIGAAVLGVGVLAAGVGLIVQGVMSAP